MKNKHPKSRADRRKLNDLHKNASPVFKLLKEKEDAEKKSRVSYPSKDTRRSDSIGLSDAQSHRPEPRGGN